MFEAKSLSCRRGARLVFRDVAFCLPAGGLLQVTGRNGSGKSSLLRVLAGLSPKAGGDIWWHNRALDDAYRNGLHYVGHQDALKPELTGDEMLDYWRALRNGAVVDFVDAFGIEPFWRKPVRVLSAGQKRRLALSRLMLGEADLWLLDEPATALDSEGQKLLGAAIAEHRAKGGTVIAAVHHVMDVADGQILTMPEMAS